MFRKEKTTIMRDHEMDVLTWYDILRAANTHLPAPHICPGISFEPGNDTEITTLTMRVKVTIPPQWLGKGDA
jgi:hypothetical protein